jgi:hypothetical protein
MKAMSKKVTRSREQRIVTSAAETMLKAAILAADDIWGVDEETTRKFINVYADIINGYGEEENGVALMDAELIERGIDVFIKKARE